MDPNEIRITVFVSEDGYYCNAVHGENFICTTVQPTLDMSLASAMGFIRDEVAKVSDIVRPFIGFDEVDDYQMAEAYDMCKER